MGSLAEVLPRIPGIYRSGEGVPYPQYGADARLAIAHFNRPMFVNDLAGWSAAGEGGYDAAFIFEALHDMARPVEALAAIRALLAADGP
jgi:hypothetical protein